MKWGNFARNLPISSSINAACEENSNDCTVVKVKTLYIVSAVLASYSPFFYKLFKNGMKESKERNVTLTINASEEEAFMNLLNFMYTNTLSASSAPDLLAVLMAADKFEVSSCISHCSKLLKEMPMSLESTLLYVEIPSSILVGEVVQSLIDKAKLYLLGRYADITKRVGAEQEEAMALPLSAIEVVLDGELLQVRSEEDVYEFITRWGRARYSKRREHQKVLTKLIERKKVSDLIFKSLYLYAGYPYGECYRFRGAVGQRFKRDYDELPIKETRFGLCHVVYLNFRTEVCGQHLDEEGRYSQVFFLGEQSFKFWVDAQRAEDGEESYLGLFLERMEVCLWATAWVRLISLGFRGGIFSRNIPIMLTESYIFERSSPSKTPTPLADARFQISLESAFSISGVLNDLETSCESYGLWIRRVSNL
ncbi:hypothetical protein V2J09_009840 [Rumex salicifolius]